MKKDIKFSTRMTSADREAIKELAKRSGMSMSDYVTACCLGKQVVVVDGLKEVLLSGKAGCGRRWTERSAQGAEVNWQKSESTRHPGTYGTRHGSQSGQRTPGIL